MYTLSLTAEQYFDDNLRGVWDGNYKDSPIYAQESENDLRKNREYCEEKYGITHISGLDAGFFYNVTFNSEENLVRFQLSYL